MKKSKKSNYQTINMEWQDIPLILSLCRDYFGTVGFAHMEVRCEEPLPITNTGYRSIFIHQEFVPELDAAAKLVLDDMTRIAEQKGWQRELQQSLFR